MADWRRREGIIGIAAQVLRAQLTLVMRPTTPYANSGRPGGAAGSASNPTGDPARSTATATMSPESEALVSVVVEAKGALLHMKLQGLWNPEIARDYQREVRALWGRCTPVFHALVDVRRSPIQVPEVAKLRAS